jgi:hypothetical protein
VNEIQGELERRLQHLEEALQRQDNAIIELKALLIRAADALDIMTQFLLISDVPLEWEENKRRENTALIAELRKAAE